MTPRILASGASGTEGQHEISGAEHHYLTRVMRSRPGDEVELFDGCGSRSRRTVVSCGARSTVVSAGKWSRTAAATRVQVRLIQAISSADKMDWTLEKAIELGISEFQPVTSARSIVRLDERRAGNRLEHWQRLAIAACRQCGRDDLPRVEGVLPLLHVLAGARANSVRLMLAAPGAGQSSGSLSALLNNDTGFMTRAAGKCSVDLLAGPESGLDENEVLWALRHGFSAVQLGSLTLRTETAALAAIAALRTLAGEF